MTMLLKFVKRGQAPIVEIPAGDLAAREYGQDEVDVVSLSRAQELEMPKEINVTYPAFNFDYQDVTQKSQRMVGFGTSVVNLPIAVVMTDEKAKEVADTNLFNAWNLRSSFSFVVSKKYAYLEPTDIVQIPYSQQLISVRLVQKDEGKPGLVKFNAVFEEANVYTQSGDGAGSNENVQILVPDIVRSFGYFLDTNLLRDADDGAGFYYVARGMDATWTGAVLYKSNDLGDSYNPIATQVISPATGNALTVLGNFYNNNVFDELNYLDVYINSGGELESRTELAVFNGANYAIVGAAERYEIIQFKSAELIATNTYRLTGLLRGRRGTQYAMPNHEIGDFFALATTTTFNRVNLDASEINLERYYKTVTIGDTVNETPYKSFASSANALECYSPTSIGGGRQANGDITINWIRRARTNGAWRNFVDVGQPETAIEYQLDIHRAGLESVQKSVTALSDETYTYLKADQDSDFPPIIWSANIAPAWSAATVSYSPVILGDYVYYGTGATTAGAGDVWRRHLITGVWTQIGGDGLNGSWAASLIEAATDLVTDGTYIYVGTTRDVGEADVWRYDPGAGTWSQIGGDGINSSWAAATFERVSALTYDGTFLYAGLGETTLDAEVWQYNIGTTTWSKIGGDGLNSSWNTSYERVEALASDATYVYAGLASSAGDGEVWRYTKATTTWSKIGGDSVNSSWTTAASIFQLIIFGGLLYATPSTQGLWSWNGTVWANMNFPNGPDTTVVGHDENYLLAASNDATFAHIYRYESGAWILYVNSSVWNIGSIETIIFDSSNDTLYITIGAFPPNAYAGIVLASATPNPLVVDVYQMSDTVGRGFVGRGLVYNANTPPYAYVTDWRILISNNNGGANVVIAEMEYFENPFYDADLATGGTASASAGTAANAFDNSTGTSFSTTDTGSVWLKYAFSEAKSIRQYSITGSSTINQSPRDWKLQRFDGASWIDMHSVAVEENWTALEKRTYTF